MHRTLNNVTVAYNAVQATGQTSNGGGHNAQGGGLYVAASTASVLNSTFAENLIASGTGGVAAGGTVQGAGLFATGGSLSLINNMIAWNYLRAYTDRGVQAGQGAGVFNSSSDTLKRANSILALDELFSSSTTPGTYMPSDLYGNAASRDHDFIGDGSGSNLVNGSNSSPSLPHSVIPPTSKSPIL